MEHAVTTLQVEKAQAQCDADEEHQWTPVHSERDLRARARQAINHDGEIKAIFLFGSRARGTPRPNSDWDVAIVSTNDDVPTLGSNVDTTRINSRVLQCGITTGSIEAVVVKYGRIIARTKGWNTMAIEYVVGDAGDMEHEFKHIIRALGAANSAMTEDGGREQELYESDWNAAMSAGTEASSDAAELLAKQIATSLGITPKYGHKVDAIARQIYEETPDAKFRQIAERIKALNEHTREAHNGGYARYLAEPETVWGLRTERTMKVLAELIEGAREGRGAFAILKTLASGAPLRKKLNAIENEVTERVSEIATGRAKRSAGTGALTSLTTLSRVITQQADSRELEPKRDPFGKHAAQTVREASALCNASVLKRARTEGVAARNTLVGGNPDTWEKGRNAIEFLAEHEDSYMRALTAYALADLGADIHGLAQRWEDAGETHAADAAQQGMTLRKARDPETAGKALRFATDKGWTDIVDEALKKASINDIHRAMRNAGTGALPQPRPGTTADEETRHVLIINALRAAGGDPHWNADRGTSAREQPTIIRQRRHAFDHPEKARRIEAKGVKKEDHHRGRSKGKKANRPVAWLPPEH